MNFLDQLTTQLYNIIWAIPLIVLALGTGLYFSLRMRFPQLRLIKDMVRFLLGKDKKKGDEDQQRGNVVLPELRAGSRRPA